jgi:hypothetical protein
LNRDLQYERTVLAYEAQSLPADLPVAHIAFEAVAARSDLHQHVLTQDELVDEFTLTNGETGSQDIVRSEVARNGCTSNPRPIEASGRGFVLESRVPGSARELRHIQRIARLIDCAWVCHVGSATRHTCLRRSAACSCVTVDAAD